MTVFIAAAAGEAAARIEAATASDAWLWKRKCPDETAMVLSPSGESKMESIFVRGEQKTKCATAAPAITPTFAARVESCTDDSLARTAMGMRLSSTMVMEDTRANGARRLRLVIHATRARNSTLTSSKQRLTPYFIEIRV